jgi:hypothetical protein
VWQYRGSGENKEPGSLNADPEIVQKVYDELSENVDYVSET